VSESDTLRNAPKRPVLAPADRHYINRISKRTTASERTTLIVPGVDISGDLEAIRNGHALKDGEYYTVNGRTWFHEENGRVFPVTGEGFIGPVGRGVMYALQALGRYNGVNAQSDNEIARHPAISGADRDEAIRIWELREKDR
jgi:hypothetical protein